MIGINYIVKFSIKLFEIFTLHYNDIRMKLVDKIWIANERIYGNEIIWTFSIWKNSNFIYESNHKSPQLSNGKLIIEICIEGTIVHVCTMK